MLAVLLRAEQEYGIFVEVVDRALDALESAFSVHRLLGSAPSGALPAAIIGKQQNSSGNRGTEDVVPGCLSAASLQRDPADFDIVGLVDPTAALAHADMASDNSSDGGTTRAREQRHILLEQQRTLLRDEDIPHEALAERITERSRVHGMVRDPPDCRVREPSPPQKSGGEGSRNIPDSGGASLDLHRVFCTPRHDYATVVRQHDRISKLSDNLVPSLGSAWSFHLAPWVKLIRKAKRRLATLLFLSKRYWNPLDVERFYVEVYRRSLEGGASATNAAGTPTEEDRIVGGEDAGPREEAADEDGAGGYAKTGSSDPLGAGSFVVLNIHELVTDPVSDSLRAVEEEVGHANLVRVRSEATGSNPKRRLCEAHQARRAAQLAEKMTAFVRAARGPHEGGKPGTADITPNEDHVVVLSAGTGSSFSLINQTFKEIIKTASLTHVFAKTGGGSQQMLYALENPADLWTDFADETFLASPIADFAEDHKDTVLERIFENIGVTNRFYVEIGTGLGSECNSRYWRVIRGWQGVMLDATADLPTINLRTALVEPSSVTETIERALREQASSSTPDQKNPDFLSIDVDSFDWHLMRSLLLDGWRPRVLIIEHIGGAHPIREKWYSRGHDVEKTSRNDRSEKQSGRGIYAYWAHYAPSLAAFVELGRAFGYDVVYYCDTDLVFVARTAVVSADPVVVEEAISSMKVDVGGSSINLHGGNAVLDHAGAGAVGAAHTQKSSPLELVLDRFVTPSVSSSPGAPSVGASTPETVFAAAVQLLPVTIPRAGGRKEEVMRGQLQLVHRGTSVRQRWFAVNDPVTLCELYKESSRALKRHRFYATDPAYCHWDRLKADWSLEEMTYNFWPRGTLFSAEELRDRNVKI